MERIPITAHGTRDKMPLWGIELWRAQGYDLEAGRKTTLAIEKLVDYLKSIQQPTRMPDPAGSVQPPEIGRTRPDDSISPPRTRPAQITRYRDDSPPRIAAPTMPATAAGRRRTPRRPAARQGRGPGRPLRARRSTRRPHSVADPHQRIVPRAIDEDQHEVARDQRHETERARLIGGRKRRAPP